MGRTAAPFGVAAARVMNEPLDWAMTINDWAHGRGSWKDAIGLLPGISVGAIKLFDKLGDSFKAVDRVADAARQTKVFWSGGETAHDAARAWAEVNNGVTLEMTALGRNTAKLTAGMGRAEGLSHWTAASREFAAGARGNIHVFQGAKGIRINSIWATTEYPTLMNNDDVTDMIYHIVD